jgi:hypothetical protein
VDKRRKTHLQIVAESSRLLDDHHRVHAGINLGVPLDGLWHPEQGIDLGVDDPQGAAGS